MKKNLRVFYNQLAFPKVLMIILDTTEVVRIDEYVDCCVLLNVNNEIVGYNLFDFNPHLLDVSKGYQSMNQALLDQINGVLQNNKLSVLEYDDTNHFIVGEIVLITPHPDSDHLNICEVNINTDEHLMIVCGAGNVREKLKVVVATLGAVLPNGKLISFNKLRGIDSYGMLCSGSELMLKGYENKAGLLELNDQYLVGTAFKDLEV